MLKIFIAALAMASAVLAAPAEEKRWQCTPGTYQCTSDNAGWNVCNTSGQWVFAGNCPPNTGCVFFPPSLSPYCVPPGFQIP